MTPISMSKTEIDQVPICEKLKAGLITQVEAARLHSLSTWQIKRKIKKYRKDGAISMARSGGTSKILSHLFRLGTTHYFPKVLWEAS